MPVYDLICVKCNYEEPNTLFKTHDLFEKAKLVCPCCQHNGREGKLERKIAVFNIGRSSSETRHETPSGYLIREQSLGPVLVFAPTPEGLVFEGMGTLVRQEIKHNPECN